MQGTYLNGCLMNDVGWVKNKIKQNADWPLKAETEKKRSRQCFK